MTSRPLVSIIVVNYKNYEFLRKCLISLDKTIYPNTETIVVDNESDLDMINILKKEFAKVRFFPSKENLDYSGGNNYGVTQSRGEFIVFLNNDTIVEKNWLDSLVDQALLEPKAFYQPKILLLDQPDIVNSLGNAVHIMGFAYPLGMGKRVSEIPLSVDKLEVFYCAGGCLFTSRETLSDCGGLDSNYWKYYEDVNLGWKGRLLGYPSYVVPGSTIYHKFGGTFGQDLSPKKLFLIERGRFSSILRNFSLRSIILLSPALFTIDILVLTKTISGGMGIVKLRASIDALRNLRNIISERKKIQEGRIKNDREIARYMSTSIEHPYIANIACIYKQLLHWVSNRLIHML